MVVVEVIMTIIIIIIVSPLVCYQRSCRTFSSLVPCCHQWNALFCPWNIIMRRILMRKKGEERLFISIYLICIPLKFLHIPSHISPHSPHTPLTLTLTRDRSCQECDRRADWASWCKVTLESPPLVPPRQGQDSTLSITPVI